MMLLQYSVCSQTSMLHECVRAGTRSIMSTETSRQDLFLFLGEPTLEGFGVAGIHHLEWACGCAAVSSDGDSHFAIDVCNKHSDNFASVK